MALRSSPQLSTVAASRNHFARFESRFAVPSTFARFSTDAQAGSDKDASAATQAPGVEETMNVPKNLVRYLIGFRGRTLASLSERSGGARLLFTKEETPNGEEVAKITGDEQQVAKMKELVLKELETIKNDPKLQESEKARNEPKAAAASGATGAPKKKNEGDYIEEVIVDASYVGYLIGKEGAVLKEMETASGARIQYSNRDDQAVERTARIRGTHEQVQAAKKLISERLYSVAEELRSGKRGSGRPPRSNSAPRNSREPSASDVKQVVEVPSECVGALIGKGGRSLFQMQDKTGAKFNFAKDDHREGAREVTIYGSEDQIRAACDVLQQRVRQVLDRNAEEPSGKQ